MPLLKLPNTLVGRPLTFAPVAFVIVYEKASIGFPKHFDWVLDPDVNEIEGGATTSIFWVTLSEHPAVLA